MVPSQTPLIAPLHSSTSNVEARIIPDSPVFHTERGALETQRARPLLLLFASRTNGVARRVEGFVEHILQRRHNHDSFQFAVVNQEDRPDLFKRFHISSVPTVLVIDDKKVVRRVRGRITPHVLEDALHDWLH